MTESFSIDTNQASNSAFVMTWFKLYSEFASDPKVQSMPESMQRRLVMLFCLHCSGDLAKLDDEELGMALRIDAEELEKTRSLFRRKGFVAEGSWVPTNWEKRQVSTDKTAAERMRRYRERLREQDRNVTRNGGATGSATLRVELELEKDKDKEIPPSIPPEGDRNVTEIVTEDITAPVTEAFPKSSRKRKSIEPLVLPDWLPQAEWDAFVEMRTKIKAPLTEYAKQLAIKQLVDFKAEGHDVVAIIRKSILGSWQGLYPPGGKPKSDSKKTEQQPPLFDRSKLV